MQLRFLTIGIIAKVVMALAIPEPVPAQLDERQCTFVKCADGLWRVGHDL